MLSPVPVPSQWTQSSTVLKLPLLVSRAVAGIDPLTELNSAPPTPNDRSLSNPIGATVVEEVYAPAYEPLFPFPLESAALAPLASSRCQVAAGPSTITLAR